MYSYVSELYFFTVLLHFIILFEKYWFLIFGIFLKDVLCSGHICMNMPTWTYTCMYIKETTLSLNNIYSYYVR